MKYLLSMLFLSSSVVAATPEIAGSIDGYLIESGKLQLSGWACASTSNQSIDVHVYAGGPYNSGGTLIAYSTANNPSEPAVASACLSTGGNYRFKILVTPQLMQQWGNKPLYIYGINPFGNTAMVNGSGNFRLPNRIATEFGAKGDGTTDDTNALQVAFDAGGMTYIPASTGAYLVSRPLLIKSDSEVLLDGTLKLKEMVDPGVNGNYYNEDKNIYEPKSAQWGILQIKNGASNVRIGGRGVIDGNRLRQKSGVCCIGGIVAGGNLLGEYDTNISNVTVQDLTIQNIPQWPVSINGTNGAKLNNLKMSNSGNSVQFALGTKNAVASNLKIDNINDIGFAFYQSVSNSSLDHSVVTNSQGTGIGVLYDHAGGDLETHAESNNIRISYNESHHNGGGFDVVNHKGVGHGNDDQNKPKASNIIFDNNISHHNKGTSFLLLRCDHCQVTNNVSYSNATSGVEWDAGVKVFESSYIDINNNTFTNEGKEPKTGKEKTTLGVSIIANTNNYIGSNNISLIGNKFIDNQSIKTMRTAINVGPGNLASPIIQKNNISCGIVSKLNECITIP